MFLYKYIDFQSDHWNYPIINRKLHFSSIDELKNVNDNEEFEHRWESPSRFFTEHSSNFSESYDRLLSNSRILCLGKNLNASCWNTFIKSGKGICYEFKYKKNGGDVTSDHVVYCDKKAFNVPEYIVRNLSGTELGDLLKISDRLDNSQILRVLEITKSDRSLNTLFEQHIYQELTFKKKRQFRKEKEYRFIHILESVGPVTPKIKLIDSKATFADLGLELNRIFTNEIEKVQLIGELDVKCSKPSFLS